MTFEVQVSIPYFNALPRDCATNVLHFDRIGPTAPDNDDWLSLRGDVVAGFYEFIYGGVGGFIASYADPDHIRFKVFDLNDATPRAPVFELTGAFGLVVEEFTILPPEVAVVCSVRGGGVSGTPAASQRGRVYLGCIPDSAAETGTDVSFSTVGEGFRARVGNAAQAMVGEAITLGFTWVVLSRKLSTTYAIIQGHVDDAFDIQRRRGQDPSIRSTWP